MSPAHLSVGVAVGLLQFGPVVRNLPMDDEEIERVRRERRKAVGDAVFEVVDTGRMYGRTTPEVETLGETYMALKEDFEKFEKEHPPR
jgi:hypothetical protein